MKYKVEYLPQTITDKATIKEYLSQFYYRMMDCTRMITD